MLRQDPLIKEKSDAKEFDFQEGQISFENVAFRHYHLAEDDKENQIQERELFNDFNLVIEPGTTNAIVGHSGFGKTTIMNLIFRLFDPHAGSIKIDGQDLKDLTFDSFRKYISIVPQNGILFNDSILYNLQYGNPEATREEIEEVAKICRIHDSIMNMSDGYDTLVGDLGSKLSGGERQRILIARGLLKKDAKIFLFDEATSNLDGKTELQITSELDEIMKGKTVLYCAHRLSSIVNVDKIHVLKDGQVRESGKHHDLLQAGGIYKQMWANYYNEVVKNE